MNGDFSPATVELWISNWKRPQQLNESIRSWLNSFEFNTVNVIINHSSVTQANIAPDLKNRVKVWNNVLRHDQSVGPQAELYNKAYVQTFLGNKKYCLCAHDNILVKKGWDEIIKNTNYDLYVAPQGDQVHLITLNGLKTFGWWDQRYGTNGHFELDYISRALHKSYTQKRNNASLVDMHGWESHPDYAPPRNWWNGTPVEAPWGRLHYNSVGLENYWQRMSHAGAPQNSSHQEIYDKLAWQKQKWHGASSHWAPGYQTTIKGVTEGATEPEVNWYPWLDLDNLQNEGI